jgi:endonuclease/exonuclease/phosphatase family metal-dependent hydrolase
MRLLLALVAVLPLVCLAGAQPRGTEATLSILTFNVRYDNPADGPDRWRNRRDQAITLIRDHGADLVGLQEALKSQLDDLLAALPEYRALGVGRDDGKEAGEYSAILYRTGRLRPVESGTFWLSESPEAPGSKSWNTACTRVCTWALFEERGEDGQGGEPTGKRFYHFNTHLDHASQEARLNGARLILERIAARKEANLPVIVTGDFNAGEENPAIRVFTAPGGLTGESTPAMFVDTYRAAHPGEREVGTFHGFKGQPGKDKIDYVLVSQGFETVSASIDRRHIQGRYPSDHFIVAAIVRRAAQRAEPGSPGSKR